MEGKMPLYTWLKQHCMAIGGVLLTGTITACSASPKSQPPVASISPVASSSIASSPIPLPTSPSQNNFNPTLPPVSSNQGAIDAGPLQREAAQVILDYYSAIDRRNYEQAYSAWEGEGAASHQSFEQFSQGFAHTASTAVTVGELGRLEGAAGSIYTEIPVTIATVTTSGTRQQFRGSYVLRQVNGVSSSTSERRKWHLYSANITQVN